MSLRKDVDKVVKDARKRGWTVTTTKRGNHLRLTHPEHGVVFMGSTPSDYRSIQNFKSLLKRKERS